VVFGTAAGFQASLDLAGLDGSNGFRLDGVEGGSGYSVAGAGDVNGDGIDDLIIGAPFADPGGRDGAGESYVVFGTAAGFGASLDLAALDGGNGFRLNGIDFDGQSGWSVAGAGDVNGDGVDDLAIGAPDAHGGGAAAGESYVVFGVRMITGTARGEVLRGTGARETFVPLQGNDTVKAGGGDYVILASTNDGNDLYLGQNGSDTVDYSALTASVSVHLGALFGGGVGGARGEPVRCRHPVLDRERRRQSRQQHDQGQWQRQHSRGRSGG
jgi:hypothetical protein